MYFHDSSNLKHPPRKSNFYQYQRKYVLKTLDLAYNICGTMWVTSRVLKGANLGQTDFERAQLYNRRERVKTALRYAAIISRIEPNGKGRGVHIRITIWIWKFSKYKAYELVDMVFWISEKITSWDIWVPILPVLGGNFDKIVTVSPPNGPSFLRSHLRSSHINFHFWACRFSFVKAGAFRDTLLVYWLKKTT